MTLIEKSVKWVYVRKTEWWVLTEHKIRPSWWKPWANIIAYYPLNWDILDHKADLWVSWTTYNLSVSFGTPTYTTSFDSSKVAFNPQATSSSSWGCWLTNSNSIWNFTWDFTISFCVKINTMFNDYMSFITNRSNSTPYRWMCSVNSSRQFFFHGSAQYLTDTALTVWTWYNITCTVLNWTYTIYFNGTAVKTWTYSYSTMTPSVLNIWFGYVNLEKMNWCISEIIIDWEWWDSATALARAKYLWFA